MRGRSRLANQGDIHAQSSTKSHRQRAHHTTIADPCPQRPRAATTHTHTHADHSRFSSSALTVGQQYLLTLRGTYEAGGTQGFVINRYLKIPVAAPYATPRLRSHVNVVLNNATWSYTVFNDEPLGSSQAGHLSRPRVVTTLLAEDRHVAASYNALVTPSAVMVSAEGTIASHLALGSKEIYDLLQSSAPHLHDDSEIAA